MRIRPPHRIAVTALTACLAAGLLAGCGSKKDNASGPSATGAQTTSASTPAAPGGAPSVGASAAATGGPFCQTLGAALNGTDIAGALTDGPAQLKQDVEHFNAAKQSLVSSAPASLKPDLSTLTAALDQVYSALAKANYDWSKVDPNLLKSIGSPNVLVALQHVEAYAKTSCGIDLGSGSASAEATAPAS